MSTLQTFGDGVSGSLIKDLLVEILTLFVLGQDDPSIRSRVSSWCSLVYVSQDPRKCRDSKTVSPRTNPLSPRLVMGPN